MTIATCQAQLRQFLAGRPHSVAGMAAGQHAMYRHALQIAAEVLISSAGSGRIVARRRGRAPARPAAAAQADFRFIGGSAARRHRGWPAMPSSRVGDA